MKVSILAKLKQIFEKKINTIITTFYKNLIKITHHARSFVMFSKFWSNKRAEKIKKIFKNSLEFVWRRCAERERLPGLFPQEFLYDYGNGLADEVLPI